MDYEKVGQSRTYAIAMWDFSWLERPEYDDWDKSLDELQERGYDALRIECYPGLFPYTQTIDPIWDANDWGSPNAVTVESFKLHDFLAKCTGRGIKVGLATWWRGSRPGTIEQAAKAWQTVLDSIQAHHDTILYVDVSNEYPLNLWTPWTRRRSSTPINILLESIDTHGLPVTYSVNQQFTTYSAGNVDMLSFNIWFAALSTFYDSEHLNYSFNRFGNEGYEKLKQAEHFYRKEESHWLDILDGIIAEAANKSFATKLPIVTTEGWGPIDYKDYEGLDWGWVKEVCEHGVDRAARTGAWKAICTSNFCGPQFKGMWGDIQWHQTQTNIIKGSNYGL
tara:strand:- start:1941 stop:2948 length:1008 start_codon:yes stop_codon:yes gene_type:complete